MAVEEVDSEVEAAAAADVADVVVVAEVVRCESTYNLRFLEHSRMIKFEREIYILFLFL